MGEKLKQQLAREEGFTLVESVVAFAILAVIMVVVAGILSFGMRIAHEQEAASKAGQLGEMVRMSIVDDLRYASSVKVVDEGSGVQFDIPAAVGVSKGSNGNLPVGTYTVSSSPDDGMVYIASQTAGKDSKVAKGPILPSKSFIDNATVTCAFSMSDDNGVAIETTVRIGTVQRTVSCTVTPLNLEARS